MNNMEFSAHAKDMIIERKIQEKWVWHTINDADKKYIGDDGNTHYVRAIHEMENRILHIIVNQNVDPCRIVTLFFDRRLGRKV